MINIVVCIKQVPHTQKVKIDPENGTLLRNNIENIINPHDLHAIEMGLSLKEQYGGSVTTITMGPPQAEDVLLEAYSLGVDKCILISDKRFAGSDSLVTSKVLFKAIDKLDKIDIVITGVEAIDGSTANVGYQLAEYLGIPLITQIHNIELKDSCAIVERLYGHEYQKIEASLPVLLAIDNDTNQVRFARLVDIKCSCEKDITVMTMDDIDGSDEEFGLPGSPTIVFKTEMFKHKREHELIDGTQGEKIDSLIHKLKKHNILRY